MIDLLSLTLAHALMLVVAIRAFANPDLNVEPDVYGRRFKPVVPRA